MTGQGPVLGIETSCDETAAGVVDLARRSGPVLADVVASQVALHAPHGGVVPEMASRQHLVDLPVVVDRALAEAGLDVDGLGGVAVTVGPGLVGALLVGLSYAKSLALAADLPLIGVHHLDGHVRAAFLEAEEPAGDYLALVVSGGHASLFRVVAGHAVPWYRLLARTLDDAPGEAFDKVGKLLGLPYPSGAAIDRLVLEVPVQPVSFPRARIKSDGGRGVTHRAFSFSGLKTSVRHHVEQVGLQPLGPGEDPRDRPDVVAVLAGFQEAVVDMLVGPTLRILGEEGLDALVVVGGVSANTLLRRRFAEACAARGARIVIPAPRWSTDNAAMIAAAGALRLAAGEHSGLDLNADPALALDGPAGSDRPAGPPSESP